MEMTNAGIVKEDFTRGDGYFEVHFAYLNKEQVEELEQLAEKWKIERIRSCIGVILTDASEQRFKDFSTNLKECIEWIHGKDIDRKQC